MIYPAAPDPRFPHWYLCWFRVWTKHANRKLPFIVFSHVFHHQCTPLFHLSVSVNGPRFEGCYPPALNWFMRVFPRSRRGYRRWILIATTQNRQAKFGMWKTAYQSYLGFWQRALLSFILISEFRRSSSSVIKTSISLRRQRLYCATFIWCWSHIVCPECLPIYYLLDLQWH